MPEDLKDRSERRPTPLKVLSGLTVTLRRALKAENVSLPRELVEEKIYLDSKLPGQLVIAQYGNPDLSDTVIH